MADASCMWQLKWCKPSWALYNSNSYSDENFGKFWTVHIKCSNWAFNRTNLQKSILYGNKNCQMSNVKNNRKHMHQMIPFLQIQLACVGVFTRSEKKFISACAQFRIWDNSTHWCMRSLLSFTLTFKCCIPLAAEWRKRKKFFSHIAGRLGASVWGRWGCVDHGQTREICEKQEKCFKGKVVTFTVHSLILYQYPVDLLNFFELH